MNDYYANLDKNLQHIAAKQPFNINEDVIFIQKAVFAETILTLIGQCTLEIAGKISSVEILSYESP